MHYPRCIRESESYAQQTQPLLSRLLRLKVRRPWLHRAVPGIFRLGLVSPSVDDVSPFQASGINRLQKASHGITNVQSHTVVCLSTPWYPRTQAPEPADLNS